jgi:hypothetical protein
LESLITSGAVIWIVLVVMAVEAVVLSRLIKSFPGILAGLGAGGSIVLALGASITNKGPMVIAACLALSFLFHVAELYFWFKAFRQKASS